jgi:Trp operon repressor
VTAAIGSTAWTALPRICAVLGSDPTDESGARRVVRVAKSNYRMPDFGLQFSIGNDSMFECGFVQDLCESSIAAEEITAGPESIDDKSDRAEARERIVELLRGGAMPQHEVLRAVGVSERTLRRASKDLGIQKEQIRDASGRVRGWQWSLPTAELA